MNINKTLFLLLLILLQFECLANDSKVKLIDNNQANNKSNTHLTSLKSAILEAKLYASDGMPNAGFGRSISLLGNRAIISSIHFFPGGSFEGKVYVFDFINENWIQSAILTADDGEDGDRFGYSISMTANRILVGANADDDLGEQSGSAYVFELINNKWEQTQKLTVTDGSANDKFGFSVSLSADRALIGAHKKVGNGLNVGAAYIFDLIDGVWVQSQKLIAPGLGADEVFFGYSVSLDGDRALIGAREKSSDYYGAAYIFDLSDNSWIPKPRLSASNGILNNHFGASVSLDGNRALIGAYGSTFSGKSISAYIFDLAGSSWVESHKLNEIYTGDNSFFGIRVSLDGNRVAIGASNDRNNSNISAGSVYLFELAGGNWMIPEKISNEDGDNNSSFGGNVSLNGNMVLIASTGDNGNGNDAGAAFIFDLSEVKSYYINKSIISSGGNASSDGVFSVQGSIGQPVTASSSGDGFQVNSGYWHESNDLIFKNSFE